MNSNWRFNGDSYKLEIFPGSMSITVKKALFETWTFSYTIPPAYVKEDTPEKAAERAIEWCTAMRSSLLRLRRLMEYKGGEK